MLEERARIDKAANEGGPKTTGGHLGQMKEMMRALDNAGLGDNKEFIEDLVELHSRTTRKRHKPTAENTHQISMSVLKLWRRYLGFKSAVHVHTPEYSAIRKEVMSQTPRPKAKAKLFNYV